MQAELGNYKRGLDPGRLFELPLRNQLAFQRLWRYFIAQNKAFFIVLLLLCLGLAGCSDGQSSSPFGASNRMSAPGSIPPLERNELQKSAAAEALRAIAPPQGIKYTKLFNEPLSSADDRLERLENAVQMMRDDLDTALPTVVRLAAVERDMKDLIAQLESFTSADQVFSEADVPNAAMVNDVVAEALDDNLPTQEAGTPPPLADDPAESAPVKTASVDALAEALNEVSESPDAKAKKTPPPLPLMPEEQNETKPVTPPPASASVTEADVPIASNPPVAEAKPASSDISKAPPAEGVLRVSGVAAKDMTGGTMIGLLVSNDLSYKPVVIDDGFRVVIDIPAPSEFTGAEPTAAFEGGALISGYAVEKQKDGGLRIVYEALSPVVITKHSLVKSVQNEGYIVQVEVKEK